MHIDGPGGPSRLSPQVRKKGFPGNGAAHVGQQHLEYDMLLEGEGNTLPCPFQGGFSQTEGLWERKKGFPIQTAVETVQELDRFPWFSEVIIASGGKSRSKVVHRAGDDEVQGSAGPVKRRDEIGNEFRGNEVEDPSGSENGTLEEIQLKPIGEGLVREKPLFL